MELEKANEYNQYQIIKNQMAKHFPIHILVSLKDEMEFPADWTHNPGHLEVALIHNFTTTLTVYNQNEWDAVREDLTCDYASDIPEATLLFDDEKVLQKFKQHIRHPQSDARMVTDQDKEEYDL